MSVSTGDVSQERVQELDINDIIDQINQAFFALDKSWRFIYLNGLASKLLERNPESLLGKNVWDEFSQAIGLRFERQYRRAMEERVAVQFEEFYEPLDAWFEVRAYPAKHGLSVYFRDISRRKRLEAEIQENRNIVSHAQKIAEFGVWEWDLEKDTIHWSEGVRRIGRHPVSTGTFEFYIQHMVAEEDKALVRESLQRALVTGDYDVEYRMLRPDEAVRMVHSHGQTIFNDEGEPVRMIGLTHDITRQREVESLLRESRERYLSLKEYNSDGICSLDFTGGILDVNPALETLVGYREAEFLQMQFVELLFPEDRELVHDFLFTKGQVQTAAKMECRMQCKQGDPIDVNLTRVPIIVNAELHGLYVIVQDLNERKRAEQLLIQSEKLSAIGQLAAGVAHEIRNPLTSLKGFLHLLKATNGQGKPEYFEIMDHELSRIDMISSEMLMLAKPHAVMLKDHDIHSILQSVVTVLEAQAVMNNVRLVTEAERTAPVNCAENQIKQVFVNLLKNAIEAMPDGGIVTIRIRQLEGSVSIEFEDKGSGIPEDVLVKIGEPFFTTKPKGTGLGMMVTRKIIENHHGRIEFRSQLGMGTTVMVALPNGRPNDVAV